MRPLTLARRERHALCDLALVLGADAPTLCGEWTARDLVIHLLVRERSPLGAAGLVVPALAAQTDRAMARLADQDFAVLVERLRDPGLTPFAIRPVEVLANTLEYVVHHEDLRRAQPGWAPRTLAPADDDAVWRAIGQGGRMLVRGAGVPVRIVRRDSGASTTLRKGADSALITGTPVEVTCFLFGRAAVAEVDLGGPDHAVARLRAADLGI